MIAELLLSVAIGLIAYALYKWLTINHDYFERRGLKTASMLTDNFSVLFLKRLTGVELVEKIYQKYPNES